jgi:hypothetical protein
MISDIVLNIIIGFVSGIIIFYVLKKYIMIKIKGPDSNIIRKRIYEYNNKKYMLEPIPTMCIK